MKKLIFRKIFPYNPTFGGKYSVYQGYCLITLQTKSPGIEEELEIKILDKLENIIFSSPLKRARETSRSIAKKYKSQKIIVLEELKEVMFDLKSLLTEEEYLKEGSNLVRKRFIESFIKDQLVEKRAEIKSRVDSARDILSKYPVGNYLLISHSFFMKILQIYLKNNKLFDHPEILSKEFDYKLKTFEFGEGFEFDL